MRTFALYALGLYFAWYLLYAWFKPTEAKSKLADLFKNSLIAWILISASRWLIAATVDLSVVFTSAIASIPSQIYEQEREKKQHCFNAPKQIVIKENYLPNADLMGNPDNQASPTWIKIKPDGDDISGPLMFFWSAVLRFFDMVYLPEQQLQGSWSTDASPQRGLSKVLIIVFVKAILALMLVVPMVILMVVNLMRVIYLWVWICFAPFIVLLNVFGIKISSNLDKYISPQNIIWLIMQPVAVVAMLSIWLIFIIELASIFNLCVPQPTDLPLWANPVKEGIDARIGEVDSAIWAQTTLGASLSSLGDVIGGITGELIIAIFVIILLWSLIKIWFTFSELTASTAKSITDGVESFAGTVPIVPLPGVWAVGASALQKFSKQWFGVDQMLHKKTNEQENTLRKSMWLSSSVNVNALEDQAATANTPLQKLQETITSETQTNVIQASSAQQIVRSWLQSSAHTTENSALLAKIGLGRLAKKRTTEELEKLWNADSPHKEDAYKLLNWLFSRGEGMALDLTNNKTQYWGRGN